MCFTFLRISIIFSKSLITRNLPDEFSSERIDSVSIGFQTIRRIRFGFYSISYYEYRRYKHA